MAVLNGTLYVVDVDSNLIGQSTNATLSIGVDLPDATTKDSGGWAEHIHGLRSWEGSADYLYDPSETYNAKDILDLITGRTGFTFLFEHSSQTAGTVSFTGSASVNSFEMGAEMEGSMTWNFSFTGNGALTITEYT